jgi:hypothetical protein
MQRFRQDLLPETADVLFRALVTTVIAGASSQFSKSAVSMRLILAKTLSHTSAKFHSLNCFPSSLKRRGVSDLATTY